MDSRPLYYIPNLSTIGWHEVVLEIMVYQWESLIVNGLRDESKQTKIMIDDITDKKNAIIIEINNEAINNQLATNIKSITQFGTRQTCDDGVAAPNDDKSQNIIGQMIRSHSISLVVRLTTWMLTWQMAGIQHWTLFIIGFGHTNSPSLLKI